MAFTLGNQIVSNIQVGPKMLITFDHTGPASYSQSTGDVVNGSDLGVGGFEFPDAGADTTNQFQGLWQLSQAGIGNGVPSAILRWYALKTGSIGGQSQTAGTEAAVGTNLSTFSLRAQIFCV